MLSNHSPFVVAEQFSTLEALHSGRIDLGLGRARGTDQVTAHAMRRTSDLRAESYLDDVAELISYLSPSDDLPDRLTVMPGRQYLPEIWMLGTSPFSAKLAGELGLSFSFGYHFNPEQLDPALETYRATFRPSTLLEGPNVMIVVPVICAQTNDEAEWLSGSTELNILQRRSDPTALLPSPDEAAGYQFSASERAIVESTMSNFVIGDPEAARASLAELQLRTSADEVMLWTPVHSYESRVQSFALMAPSV